MAKEFNIIINTGDEALGNRGYIKYRGVSSIDKFKLFASTKFPNWLFATVYDKSIINADGKATKTGVIKP